jgi:hypothetical protein
VMPFGGGPRGLLAMLLPCCFIHFHLI